MVWMGFCIVPYFLFVIVCCTSDPDVRSLWSLCLKFLVWIFVTGGLVCRIGMGSTLVRAITAFVRGGRSRHVLAKGQLPGC